MNATLFKRLFFYYFPFKNLLSQLVRALHTIVVFFHLVIEPIDEFHVEIEPTAKIFGAVSGTISLMRLSALLAFKRCRCRYDGFCSCYLARFRCNSRIPSTLSQISFRLQCAQSTSTLSRMWFKASRTSDEQSEIA